MKRYVESPDPGIGDARAAFEAAVQTHGDQAPEAEDALEKYMESVRAFLAMVDEIETAINSELGGAYMRDKDAMR